MPFGRKSPLEALALPGVMLAYKYSQFRQRRREAASRRVTERELSALHHKIDKLLSKLEESEPDPPTSQEDECVICINARATMQTSPCGHRVVCRRCFVKTIQSAVAQRLLPLRCVICRARVNRLTSSSGTWRIQESASSYSMGSKSWASASLVAGNGVSASASSYSMSDAHSGLIPGERHTFHGGGGGGGGIVMPNSRFPRSPNGRVAQSASLYSMSSGSSTLSSVSNATNYSKTSSISSGLYTPSPSSPISPGSATSTSSCSVLGHHLAPPHASSSSTSPGSGGSLSPRNHHHHHHQHHHQHHSHQAGCPSGCSGAIPRKPLQSLSGGSTSSNASCSSTGSNGSGTYSGIAAFTPSTNTYPGRRHTKGRLMDLQNRLPPIKEFRSPAKVPHPSPVHISNPRFRYSSYTKSATNPHEMVPLLREPPSPPKRPMNIHVTSSLTTFGSGVGPPPLKAGAIVGGSAKISPLTTKHAIPKNAYIMPNEKKKSSSNNNINNNNNNSSNKNISNTLSNNNNNNNNSSNSNINNRKLLQDFNSNTKPHATKGTCNGNVGNGVLSNSKIYNQRTTMTTSSSSRSFPLFSSSSSSNNHKEKADNKKNESMERKKKEEKLKQKAEKEARKEEKRLAKEEERLAKLLAKEEKKKGKKEAKELLLANDGNNKK